MIADPNLVRAQICGLELFSTLLISMRAMSIHERMDNQLLNFGTIKNGGNAPTIRLQVDIAIMILKNFKKSAGTDGTFSALHARFTKMETRLLDRTNAVSYQGNRR